MHHGHVNLRDAGPRTRQGVLTPICDLRGAQNRAGRLVESDAAAGRRRCCLVGIRGSFLLCLG